ncbi:hypothetical protein O0L34_g13697 [Tuta absoluta]|nr:hypothetical protein O0L34_g13697 [Tuta absoluta]
MSFAHSVSSPSARKDMAGNEANDDKENQSAIFVLYPRPSRPLVALRNTMRGLTIFTFGILTLDVWVAWQEEPVSANIVMLSVALFYCLFSGLVFESIANRRAEKDRKPLVFSIPPDVVVSVGVVETV